MNNHQKSLSKKLGQAHQPVPTDNHRRLPLYCVWIVDYS